MNYTQLYQLLKTQFSPGVATLIPGEERLLLSSESFHSKLGDSKRSACTNPSLPELFNIENQTNNPNKDFTYPVFYPSDALKNDKCIILLHGLNERSWDKYLPWGYQLAKNTRRPVILFPIAYHMNRSPHSWSDPRAMLPFVKQRKQHQSSTAALTVANVALSQRLTDHPERFLLSGYQAAKDILELTTYIESGLHPAFNKGSRVDFFAYSIGTFLAQNLLLAHGNDLLAQSKFFFFCGGSTFAEMKGISKYIMDSVAFDRLIHYYSQELEMVSQKTGYLNYILHETALGQSFSSMLSLEALKKRGADYFSTFKDRLAAITLSKDQVILPQAIKKTLQGINLDEWDFDFPYSHEAPFPILSNKLVNKVNEAFDKVFIHASMLFTH